MTRKTQLLRVLLLATLMYGGAFAPLMLPSIRSGPYLEQFHADIRSIVNGATVGLLLFIVFDIYPRPLKKE